MKLKNVVYAFFSTFVDSIRMLITYWPGASGNFVRYQYYKRKLNYLGQRVVIDFGVHIVNPSHIMIGDNTHIDRHVTLIAGKVREGARRLHYKKNPAFRYADGEIHIGRNIHIAPYSYLVGIGGIDIEDNSGIASGARIFSISHHHRNINDPNDEKMYSFSNTIADEEQAIIVGPVVMQENSAIGLNSVVLPGSTIGKNSWVGVLSCVKGTIPPNVIAMGCPATVIKDRFE
jgi:acetyltransferase-like isoleucine patch superfamily enzyme